MESPNDGASQRSSRKYLANKFGRVVDTLLEDYNPDKYIDDENLYVPRIHPDTVNVYNNWVLNHLVVESPNPLTSLPSSHSNSMILPSYSQRIVSLLVSMHWDKMYLLCLFLWCILFGLTLDKYLLEIFRYSPNSGIIQSQILLVISVFPMLMFISAIIPSLTVWVSFLTCHSTLRQIASRNVQNWSIVAIFLAQFLEFNSMELKLLLKMFQSKRVQPLHEAVKLSEAQLEVGSQNQSGHQTAHQEKHNDQRLMPESADIENPVNISGSIDHDEVEGITRVKPLSLQNTESLEITSPNSSRDESRDYPLYPPSMFAETGEFVARIRHVLQEKQSHDEKQRKHQLQLRRQQALLKDPRLVEWTCCTCNRHNSEPVHGYHEEDIFVVEDDEISPKVFMKQMEHSTPKPICSHCLTPYDYKPPDCSKHLFPQEGNRTSAFAHYPIPHNHHSDANRSSSCFHLLRRTIRPSPYQRILYRLPMDWRLPLYLSSQLPEPLRYDLQGGSYAKGEVVECRVQKLEWTKGMIVNDHRDGYYDIRYESGEEVEFEVEMYSARNFNGLLGELHQF